MIIEHGRIIITDKRIDIQDFRFSGVEVEEGKREALVWAIRAILDCFNVPSEVGANCDINRPMN